MEFSKPNTPVYLCNLEDVLEETTMGLLLPGAFDLNNI
jgi:cytidine deaminase